MTKLEHQPDYLATAALDTLRRDDYARLDASGQVYLDYTGAGLYGDSQVRAHLALLADQVLGNPHSVSRASSASTSLVEGARRAVLEYFDAADDYVAIFTANATGALKHVGESYPFAPGGRFLLSFDNHNSVNGIREFAIAAGATVCYAPVTVPDLRLDIGRLTDLLDEATPGVPHLFAFPAQSNFSGVKHPLELIAAAQARGWDVLLDAAAFVATNPLNLRQVKPEKYYSTTLHMLALVALRQKYSQCQ